MAERYLKLTILSPCKQIYSGEVFAIKFPGERSPFTVLYNHAPFISSLGKGTISWGEKNGDKVDIESGFVEVKKNCVVACVELEGELLL